MAKRLIYAEDALEILDRDKAYMSDVGRIHARNAVNECPTVDAKMVVHGRWIYEDPDENNNVPATCSVCGAGDCHAVQLMHKIPYCWKCGADMRGEEDG